MERYDPEAARSVPLRGASRARRVVVSSGGALTAAAVAATLTARSAAAPLAVVAAAVLALGVTTALLGPRTTACAVRRAALGTIAKLSLVALIWALFAVP